MNSNQRRKEARKNKKEFCKHIGLMRLCQADGCGTCYFALQQLVPTLQNPNMNVLVGGWTYALRNLRVHLREKGFGLPTIWDDIRG
jgi:hypothetical protein